MTTKSIPSIKVNISLVFLVTSLLFSFESVHGHQSSPSCLWGWSNSSNGKSLPSSCLCLRWCQPAISSLWRPLLLLPSVFPSTSDFSNELAIWIRWPKYWSFSFSISPSNEYSGLISIKIDWFDLPAVHGTLSLLLQHDSLKASILWCSAFFMVQLSQLYVTTGKTIALTIWTFVGKVMFLLFNTLSRFVIAFLPRSNCLLISWLQSPSTVILEPKKRKPVTTPTFSPFYLPCSNGA